MSEEQDQSAAFQFEQWAERVGLNRKSVKFLRTEELVEIRTLELIDDRDIVMMPLPMGLHIWHSVTQWVMHQFLLLTIQYLDMLPS